MNCTVYYAGYTDSMVDTSVDEVFLSIGRMVLYLMCQNVDKMVFCIL